MAFLLPPGFPADVNGDLFYRKGFGSQVFATPIPGDPDHFHLFSCSIPQTCSTNWLANPFFQTTQSTNPPGQEAQSILLMDPQFLSWPGETAPLDDFRLKPGSPARNAGVLLPIYFQQMDVDAAGVAVADIGAYQRQRTTGLAANCFPPQNWQATAKYLRGFRAACVGKRCHFVSDGN